MKKLILFIIILLVNDSFSLAQNNRICKNDITRLTPYEATYNNGIVLNRPNEKLKGFWLENWTDTLQSIKWSIFVEKSSQYRIEGIIGIENIQEDESIELVLINNHTNSQCIISSDGWHRAVFNETIYLPKGNTELILKIKGKGTSPNFNAKFYALELAIPEVYQAKQQKALAMKADVEWMNEITYGFFFHWNSKSMPKSGEPLSYEDAVNRFDTDKFAKLVDDCGGKLVFFTTSWAGYYFPAPLKNIDAILPNRTTKRDLIADLACSLKKYNIRLIIYYHMGHGDKEWWDLQDFSKDNSKTLFANIEKIIGEISDRYKNQIAGIWMDDGRIYYHNQASFEKINQAAKRGNKNMAVSFNSWILPKVTDFQDFYAGELGISLYAAGVNNPYLPIGGSGYFINGPQKGLKATYNGTFEPGEWTHIYKDKPIDEPMYSLQEMKKIIKESRLRKNLPMINLRIYQDGSISPQTYNIMTQLKEYCKQNNL